MLKLATRQGYHTLTDAVVLQGGTATAITYLEADAAPVTVTGAAFVARVQGYAGALAAYEVRPRDLIIIAHTQNLESIYLFWAALWLGAVPSMFPTLTEKLDPEVYARDMAVLVRASDVRAVFTTDDFAPQLRETVGCPVYGSVTPTDSPPPAYNALPDDIAFLQHSSGTTGLQKGVALSHTAVLNQLASYSEALALDESDVIVSWLPLYHDMGLIAGFLLPLVAGVPLVLMSPFDWVKHPASLLRAIHDYGGTLCWLPNFAYNHMARRVRDRDIDGVRLDSMRAFINCSEPVRFDSHTAFVSRFADIGVTPDVLAVSYAMAENTFAVTQTPPGASPTVRYVDQSVLEAAGRVEPGEMPHVACGAPIPGTAVRILDADAADLPEYRIGEVAVKSDYMLSAYHKRPDLNPFTADGWYMTGDMGYIADGEVYITGRKKDLIINAGKNIFPGDIEAVVNTVEGIKPGRAVVFGVPDVREGTELIALVAEILPQDPAERKRINRAVRGAVASQTTVTLNYVTLVAPGWLLKTSSGKIARGANRDKWLSERA